MLSKKSKKAKPSTLARDSSSSTEHSHSFSTEETRQIRTNLLRWYDDNQRSLPWRDRATDADPNKRAYAVWVSEIMLQQTQVATVIDYYNRWMEKWPTVEDLSRANLEEVNSLWSGLGYYSRARRLHEGAKKVVDELGGSMPTKAADLLKQLPGVGRYTAAAIASIAFGEITGVVDGNVIRVLSRLRSIGAQSSSNTAMEKFWELSNKIVDDKRPGDFNQALMEFGAKLCTPQSPQCSKCPLRLHCSAFKQVEEHKTRASLLLSGQISKACPNQVGDIEECKLCLPGSSWEVSLGVCNYPQKAKKKQPKDETVAVCIIENDKESDLEFLVVQRPKTGLLAGLWEFPNIVVEEKSQVKKIASVLSDFLQNELGVTVAEQNIVGEVSHNFSHIHHKYIIHSGRRVADGENIEQSFQAETREVKWLSKQELKDAALSTAMRKVFTAYENCSNSRSGQNNSKKRKRSVAIDSRKQMMLDAFLKPKNSAKV